MSSDLTALDVLRRLAEATGSPASGGVDPKKVGWEGFCLPGGGMRCFASPGSTHFLIIRVYCWPGICRAQAILDSRRLHEYVITHHPSLRFRDRDRRRAEMWCDIAGGMSPAEAAKKHGLGESVWEAHVETPTDPSEISPVEALRIAVRNPKLTFDRSQLFRDLDLRQAPDGVIEAIKGFLIKTIKIKSEASADLLLLIADNLPAR